MGDWAADLNFLVTLDAPRLTVCTGAHSVGRQSSVRDLLATPGWRAGLPTVGRNLCRE